MIYFTRILFIFIISGLSSAFGMYYYLDPDTYTKKNTSLMKTIQNYENRIKNYEDRIKNYEDRIKNYEDRKICKYRGYGWKPDDIAAINASTKPDKEQDRCVKDLKKYWKGSAADTQYPGCGSAFCCEKVCTIEEIKDNII